jgi:hypothetical protein
MVDELSKELAKIGEEVIVVSPYYKYNSMVSRYKILDWYT